MSEYTDYMEEMFFNRVSEVREVIYENRKWKDDYLSKRSSFPDWVNRDGKHIPVSKVTDSHLENLLRFLSEEDVWHTVFACEKRYRELCRLEEEDRVNNC